LHSCKGKFKGLRARRIVTPKYPFDKDIAERLPLSVVLVLANVAEVDAVSLS